MLNFVGTKLTMIFRAPLADEYTVLILAGVSSFIGWTHFVVSIIREMCGVLRISAFTIPYKLKK